MFTDESPTIAQIDNKQVKENSLTRCPRCLGYHLINIDTGEIIPGRCNTYACEYCGWRKKEKLAKALTAYFKQFPIIRFWTFSFQSKIFELLPEQKNLQIASEIWRRFVTYVRRSNTLSNYQKNVQYVKVTELHKSGIPHFHVFFDRWIPRHHIQALWEKAILSLVDYKEKTGNAFVEGIKNPKAAAKYVCKYLMKTVAELSADSKSRIWSKSSKAKIFGNKPLYSSWKFYNARSEDLYLFSLRVSSQEEWLKIQQHLYNPDKEFKYITNTS